MKIVNLLGQRVGKLKIVECIGSGSRKKKIWRCVCDCGNITLQETSNLTSGRVIGCGKCRSNIGNQYGTFDLTTYDSAFKIVYRTVRLTAKQRGLEFGLTEEQVYKINQRPCAYCGDSPHSVSKVRNRFGKSYIYNGIDRVDNNVGYTYENCVACCEWCNKSKLAHGVDDFKEHISKIYSHWASK